MYAFASGIPVLLISLLGPIIQRLHPEVGERAGGGGEGTKY